MTVSQGGHAPRWGKYSGCGIVKLCTSLYTNATDPTGNENLSIFEQSRRMKVATCVQVPRGCKRSCRRIIEFRVGYAQCAVISARDQDFSITKQSRCSSEKGNL